MSEVSAIAGLDLERVNREFGHDPQGLLRWALGLGERSIVTTSFGPFSAVMLHMATGVAPALPVVWIDSGYNTTATYKFAAELTRRLRLNLHVYQPRRSRAHREAVEGRPPTLDEPGFEAFAHELKLEPFERIVRDLQPRVWLTAIRAEETAHRATLQPASVNSDGVLKIAPVLHWTSRQMNDYLKANRLPNNFDYYDPTKVEEKRECGLHVAH